MDIDEFDRVVEISEVKVCQSAAGYYVGQTYTNGLGHEGLPYSRCSPCYWRTREEAEAFVPAFTDDDRPYHDRD